MPFPVFFIPFYHHIFILTRLVSVQIEFGFAKSIPINRNPGIPSIALNENQVAAAQAVALEVDGDEGPNPECESPVRGNNSTSRLECNLESTPIVVSPGPVPKNDEGSNTISSSQTKGIIALDSPSPRDNTETKETSRILSKIDSNTVTSLSPSGLIDPDIDENTNMLEEAM